MKSTLVNLPIYYLSTLTIPKEIAKKLEATQCRFLWGDEEGNRKYHLVKWEDIKKPAYKGGLGIRSLVKMNAALYGKCLWKYLDEENILWRNIVNIRWGDQDFASGGACSRPHGRGLWKNIKQWPCFMSCINWRLGRGNKIRFWLDKWIGEDSLNNKFPRIFELAQSKLLVVAEADMDFNDRVQWSVDVSRHLNDWEIKDYEDLLQILETQSVRDESDQCIWKMEKKEQFSASPYYRFLIGGDARGILDSRLSRFGKLKCLRESPFLLGKLAGKPSLPLIK